MEILYQLLFDYSNDFYHMKFQKKKKKIDYFKDLVLGFIKILLEI